MEEIERKRNAWTAAVITISIVVIIAAIIISIVIPLGINKTHSTSSATNLIGLVPLYVQGAPNDLAYNSFIQHISGSTVENNGNPVLYLFAKPRNIGDLPVYSYIDSSNQTASWGTNETPPVSLSLGNNGKQWGFVSSLAEKDLFPVLMGTFQSSIGPICVITHESNPAYGGILYPQTMLIGYSH